LHSIHQVNRRIAQKAASPLIDRPKWSIGTFKKTDLTNLFGSTATFFQPKMKE
jgi:hypothetical protein